MRSYNLRLNPEIYEPRLLVKMYYDPYLCDRVLSDKRLLTLSDYI